MAEHGESDREDADAILDVLGGDSHAFRGIVERYHGPIYSLSISYLRNRGDAEDATQEIFLRAFRALGSFSVDRRFLPWLYSIAINYLKTYRKRPVVVRDTATVSADTIGLDQQPDRHQIAPEEEFAQAQQRGAVRNAVARLPGKIRDVVLLYYFQELSIDETAEALHLSTENVKSRLFRARKKLKKLLGPDGAL
jgi:RNA polymerase sigma-70 factor (ECF subfamily)